MNIEKHTSASIRQVKLDNPRMRERDIADQLGISEAEYVAAWLGHGATRITTDMNEIFPEMEALGTVLALTRNENAVHEKVGVYDNFIGGKRAAMMLGELIDTRMFPSHWVYGFAFENTAGDTVKRSFQFFDAHGEAVHKIHLREESNIEAWQSLAQKLALDDQSSAIPIEAIEAPVFENDGAVPVDELQTSWRAMTDTHQFFNILQRLKISRLKAVECIGDEYAWKVEATSVAKMLEKAAQIKVPIMCFVANRGCIQIHSGPVVNIKEMGPWLNIMDETFHLHLRQDRIHEVWVVRKPTDKGHVTSLEAYDAQGELIIQFFGKRAEGQEERGEWRQVLENLPNVQNSIAA